MSKGDVCAPWHKTRQNTKNAPNFLELRQREVRRTLPSRNRVAKPRYHDPSEIGRLEEAKDRGFLEEAPTHPGG